MITIPLNENTGIRIPAWTPPEKSKKERTEVIPLIGVSIPKAAKMLGIGKPKCLSLIKEGKIRAVMVGKWNIVSVQSIRDFVDGKNTSDNSAEKSDELQGKKE